MHCIAHGLNLAEVLEVMMRFISLSTDCASGLALSCQATMAGGARPDELLEIGTKEQYLSHHYYNHRCTPTDHYYRIC